MLKKINIIIAFTLITIITSLITNIANSSNNLPNFGNETQSIISTKQEILIGKTILHQLQHDGMIYQDPISTEYINHLGNILIANTEQIDLNKFNFFIINGGKEINAFAFFGGNIGIFPELINTTETESELAAILAHEISHITQKHHARQLLRQKQLLPITIAGTIATSIINPHLASLILGGHMQHMLNFSRENEQEADRIGIQLLTKAGFDPQAMPNIFQRFNQPNASHQKIPEYLLTHPMFESRISDALSKIKSNNYKQFIDPLDYHLIKARIKASSSINKLNLLHQIENQLKTNRYNNYIALKYQQSLVLKYLQKFNQATIILQELIKQDPENIILQLSLIDLQKINNPKSSQLKLANLMELYPDYLPLILEYAEILLKLDQPQEAKNILQKYNTNNIYQLIEEPKIYQLLIACLQKLDDKSETLLTQAKLLIINDQLSAAKNKGSQALKVANKYQINNIKKFQNELDLFMQDLAKI